jgi:hypothetical protein
MLVLAHQFPRSNRIQGHSSRGEAIVFVHIYLHESAHELICVPLLHHQRFNVISLPGA